MKLLSIIVTVVALAALGVGGTLAVFNDVETSTGNTFTAGTLNLVNAVAGTGPVGKFVVTPGGDGINGNVVFGSDAVKLKPGESGSITWTVQNTGSVAGTLTMLASLASAENGTNEPETVAGGAGEPGEMDLYMGVQLTGNGTYLVGSATNYGKWSDLVTALNAQTESMAGGASRIYVLSWSLALDLKGAGIDLLFGTGDDVPVDDNIIQSDSITLDITFTLTQS
ncbi:MAG: SipW-dependent-type signal peptide-containing protein [Dehalococcoidia bacterium]|nr:SipW-dependent-type signal peptide-containing protein [Dehalococcoidia bacterium]